MALSSLAENLSHVTQTPLSRKKSRGAVCAMTRHKRELARLVTLRAPAAAVRLLHVLLTSADDDGITWWSVPRIREAMPRSARRTAYDKRTIQLAAVWCRRAGLLTWDRVMPLGRYPRRNKEGKAVLGCGPRTFEGGRVWRLNLPALRGEGFPLSSDGTVSAGYDLQILSGYDLQIPSSDPLEMSSSKTKGIPRRRRRTAPGGCAAS